MRMDFNKTLNLLIKEFSKKKIRYAVIGGFAVGVWGFARNTLDLDILADKNDLEKIDNIMQKLFYKRVFSSENVSQYVSDIVALGEVDFIHAFRFYSTRALKRAKKKRLGDIYLKIAAVEDIVGFKLQAMANDKKRQEKELLDIKELLRLNRKRIDWRLLEEYFTLFNKKKLFKKLKDEVL